jgi:glycine/D-amino acid oxidase-like deaminating enzyme
MTEENRMTLLALDPSVSNLEEGDRAKRDYEAVTGALAGGGETDLQDVGLVIVGGGIVGFMAAYYATQAGAKVTLIESRAFGGAASGRNAGGIYAAGRDVGEVALARVSMDLWEELGDRGLDVKFQKRGHTIVALNGLELSILHRASDVYARAGVNIEVLEGSAAAAELPFVNPDLAGAMFSPDDGQGYPFTAITSLRDAFVAGGGKAVPHTKVTGLMKGGDRIVGVHTTAGNVLGDYVLLAAGPWTTSLGEQVGAHLPVRARRSQLTVSERVVFEGNFPFVSGNRVYARQTHTGNILIGGGGPWEENGYHTTTSQQALEIYGKYMTEMFPGLARVPIIRAFAGTVELTPDHYPILGSVPGAPGLWVSAGYNGHGFGLSASSGRLFVELLRHEIAQSQVPKALLDALAAYSPERFSQDKERVSA